MSKDTVSTFTKWQLSDEFHMGFDDGYDLESCNPLSDIPECQKAYREGYGEGVESWVKIEYPEIHHLGKYVGYGNY